MTTAHNLDQAPETWEQRKQRAIPGLVTQPQIGPMVYGDACDIHEGRGYCGSEVGVREAIDADGRTRILCAMHAGLYFPSN